MSLVPYMRTEKEQKGIIQNMAVPYPSPVKTTLLFSVFYFGAYIFKNYQARQHSGFASFITSVTNGDLRGVLHPYSTSSGTEPLATVSIFAWGQLGEEGELEIGIGVLHTTAVYGEVVWTGD